MPKRPEEDDLFGNCTSIHRLVQIYRYRYEPYNFELSECSQS